MKERPFIYNRVLSNPVQLVLHRQKHIYNYGIYIISKYYTIKSYQIIISCTLLKLLFISTKIILIYHKWFTRTLMFQGHGLCHLFSELSQFKWIKWVSFNRLTSIKHFLCNNHGPWTATCDIDMIVWTKLSRLIKLRINPSTTNLKINFFYLIQLTIRGKVENRLPFILFEFS